MGSVSVLKTNRHLLSTSGRNVVLFAASEVEPSADWTISIQVVVMTPAAVASSGSHDLHVWHGGVDVGSIVRHSVVHADRACSRARNVESVLAISWSSPPTRQWIGRVKVHDLEGAGEHKILVVVDISLDLGHTWLTWLVTDRGSTRSRASPADDVVGVVARQCAILTSNLHLNIRTIEREASDANDLSTGGVTTVVGDGLDAWVNSHRVAVLIVEVAVGHVTHHHCQAVVE